MANIIKNPIIDGLKKCSNCNKHLTVDKFSKARKFYSAKCKDCTNEYIKAYRAKPENKLKMRLYHQEYKKDPANRAKLNKRQRAWGKKPKSRITKNNQRKLWTLNEKRKSIKYKGGKCIVCGYDKCEAALEFHHLDPKMKIGIKDHLSFKNSISELDKCVLLCCRCHREFHAGLVNLTNYINVSPLRV